MTRILSCLAALAGLLFIAAVPASAADQTPAQFLHGIYDLYLNGGDGPPLDNAALPNFFTPELVDLIEQDAADAYAHAEVPRLDGDPFIDAQDWQISNLDIKVEEKQPGFAVGTVKFRNMDRDDEIRLDLQKLAQGWRIAEIYAPSGRLRELFGR